MGTIGYYIMEIIKRSCTKYSTKRKLTIIIYTYLAIKFTVMKENNEEKRNQRDNKSERTVEEDIDDLDMQDAPNNSKTMIQIKIKKKKVIH